MPVSATTYLQATKNKMDNVGLTLLTLRKTSSHNWQNLFTEPESFLPEVNTSTSFWQFNLQTFAVQLVGDANIIEQHVTETTCINVICPTLKVGICVPTDYTKQIIV